MKKFLVIALVLVLGGASAITCPFTSGKVVEVCNVDIQPEKPTYDQDLVLNITKGFLREFSPIEKGSDVEIWFYNTTTNVKKVKFKTDDTGIITFTPEIVGYHLIKVCGKTILIFVNSTCGDGICYGYEGRGECPQDCGFCGDYICDANEDVNCPDCAECGDGICSGGESKEDCVIDCHVCGDKECDEPEDYGSCRLDCPSGGEDGLCDMQADGICDPDCRFEDDIDCKVVNEEVDYPGSVQEKDDSGFESMFFIPLAIIVVCAVLVVLLFRKYGKKDERLEGWKPREAGGEGAKAKKASKGAVPMKDKTAEKEAALEQKRRKELARIAEKKRKALEKQKRVLEEEKRALEEEKRKAEEARLVAEQRMKEELMRTEAGKKRQREMEREEAQRKKEEAERKKKEDERRKEAQRWREIISKKYAKKEELIKGKPKAPKPKPKEEPKAEGPPDVHKSVKNFLKELRERSRR